MPRLLDRLELPLGFLLEPHDLMQPVSELTEHPLGVYAQLQPVRQAFGLVHGVHRSCI